MSDKTPELNDDPTVSTDETPIAAAPTELTEKDLDKAAGGAWPFVTTAQTYYKPV